MMMSNHYASQPSAHYAYGQPQGPPSPPMDETSKCSLPSISNLLGLADGGSPTTEHSPASQQASSHKADARPDSSHYNNVAARSGALPPTPPMSSDASFEGYHSPSTKSVSQLSAASNYFYDAAPAMGHVESEAHRQQQMAPRLPIQAPSYAQSAFAASSYMGPPAMASYYPAMQPTPPPQPQVSGLYYQRPLPHAFPPMPLSVAMPSTGSNPWQHHHYISPSSAASFPQSQDRYICQTCNKAFSRPSSLRIHSHSHTGEKPFKCPHAGCGKAFSVRSNMKRHERGCHNFETSSNGSPLMS
ncbi:hypothetical protein J7T55_012028 [Diaporthe amygdali]|uniref:uncharacterized protein n=1 Tax=Phomopsis amygdali TaxID=1214568 RepID=UPI0022FDD877|nr:uncharacterized protein J7T55_012028 [Diaporthe amygdali]KAJ0123563.1 hypothetical protein J7T55_012028 [Diaporthe amygdali]